MLLPHKGRVVWFDASSGEGTIQGDDGAIYYVHYSCIVGARRGFRVNLTAGHQVEFSIYSNLYSKRINQCREIANAA